MTTPSRARRYLDGVSLGVAYLAIVTVAGLWLAPFLIGRFGQAGYGLWLVGTQLLAYLALLDLGVVALLPREVAFATGSATPTTAVADVLATSRRVTIRQVPLVALVAVGLWLGVQTRWPELGGPLGIALTVFVLSFPARVYQAALQGLQDLRFMGLAQLAAWSAGTAITVALALQGVGLVALAAGWSATHLIVTMGARVRFAARHRAMMTAAAQARVQPNAGRVLLSQSLWLTASQIAQVLLTGSDALVIAAMLGASAVVPFVCTAKLAAVAANLPYLLVNTSLPALSEARGRGEDARVLSTVSAVGDAVLVSSGLLASGILVVNAAFVAWWVGPGLYAGATVTALVVLTMVLRHFNVTLAKLLFSAGQQRALSVVALADGVIGVVLMALLVPVAGLPGAALAQVIAVTVVAIPVHVALVVRVFGETGRAYLRRTGRTALRVSTLLLAAAAVAFWLGEYPSAGAMAAGMLALGVLFAVIVLPVTLQAPLRPFVDRATEAVERRGGWCGTLGRGIRRTLPHFETQS